MISAVDRAWTPWVLAAMVAAVFASRMWLHERVLRAEITSDTLELSGRRVPTKKGRYLFPLSDISDVQLLSVLPEGMPDYHRRLDSMRGVFELPELGRVVVLLDRMEPPFLLLRVDWPPDSESHVLLRLKDEPPTRALFERLHAERGDPRWPGEPSDELLEVEAE